LRSFFVFFSHFFVIFEQTVKKEEKKGIFLIFWRVYDTIQKADFNAKGSDLMNQPPSTEQMKERQKKNIKLVFLILAGLTLLSVLALVLIDRLLPKEQEQPEKDIYFHPVSEGNIFENGEYLALNRFVYYCEDPSGYGLTTQITDEDRMTFDVKVRFAETYLNTLMLGDSTALRAMCTENYLKENQIPNFTQQMIYESHIYYYSTEAQKDGSKLVTYRLEYKIYQNNGTYRRDVGSDSPKPEYLVLWVSPDESDIKIEKILRF
jgi:hypothetical protein